MSLTSPSVRTIPDTTTTLTPYLRLPHLLSLSWLAYPIVSLLFVAFQLQVSLAASQEAVANAKGDLLTSCRAAEQASGSAANMPRIMAIASNQQFVDAVNGSLRGAQAGLILSLTVMEAIINFVIDLYRSTLLCFLELAVRTSLSLLISVSQEVNTLLKDTSGSLQTSIQSSIQSANDAIKSAADKINRIPGIPDITPPQINVPSLDSLANLQVPSKFQESLNQMNSSLPSVEDLKAKLETFINTPFELLKKEINDTFSEISFNSSMMPVPDKSGLSFCDDIDTSVIDEIGQDLKKTAKIGTLILAGAALIFIGLNCLWIWYKWRSMKAHFERTRGAWLTDPTIYQTETGDGVPRMTLTDHNLLMLQANASHPFLARIMNRLSQLLRLSTSQHIHLQWFLNYIFHPPAVAVLLVGLFGLLCVEMQLLAMGPMVAKYQGRAASSVSDFTRVITTSINNSMNNQSAAYANAVNARVDATQNTLNEGLFGWVNGSTTTVNNTINEFYTGVEGAVNGVFGGTVLERPAQEFLRCLLGTKVAAIENALTFLHDNLKIEMPRVNDSILVVSQDSVDEAVAPIAAAAIGGGADDDQGLIGRLVNSYASSLKKERITFIIFIGLWVLVVLIGLAVVLWHSCRRKGTKNNQQSWNEKSTNPDVVVFPSASPTDVEFDSKRPWDSSLEDIKLAPPIEQKKSHRKPPPPPIPKRFTSWFGLGRQQESNNGDNNDLGGAPGDNDVPKSRWSQSPNTSKAPWSGFLSPSNPRSPISMTSRTPDQKYPSWRPPPVPQNMAGVGTSRSRTRTRMSENPFIAPGEHAPFESQAF